MTTRAALLTLAACVIAVAACAAGLRGLGFTNDSRVFFDADNPERAAFEALERTFSPTQNVLIALSRRNEESVARRDGDGTVLAPDGFAALGEIVARAPGVPHFDRVLAPTNLPVPLLRDGALTAAPLMADPAALTVAEAAAAALRAQAEPALVGRLLSADGRIAAASINLSLPAGDPDAVDAAVAAVRALADDMRARYPELAFHLTGPVLGGAVFGEATEADLRSVMPIVVGIVVVLLLLTLRSAAATGATLVVVGASAATALGIAGWWGLRLNPASAGAPPIIMTLAVADSIHLITGMRQAQARGLAKRDAIAESLRLNLWPIFLTSATTAIGFLTMNASAAPPLRDLGNITAIGVAAAFVLSVTLLPLMLTHLRLGAPQAAARARGLMAGLGALLVRHRRLAFLACLAAALGLGAGISRISTDDRFVDYLDQRFELRRASDFVGAHLTGLDVIEHALPAGERGDIGRDAYLRTVDRFAMWYRSQPGVAHVFSLADVVRRLNRAAHDEAPAFARLPEEENAGGRLLAEFARALQAGPGGFGLVDESLSASRLIVTVRDASAADLRALAAAAESWLAREAPAMAAAPATGLSLMYAHVSSRSIEGMLRSTAIALVLISCLLVLALRSVRIGLASLVPNLAPAVIGLGLWGWMYGNIGIASSVVMAMTLGIVVDNTIHFLSKYLHARRTTGAAPEAAVAHAFATVGSALAINALVLAAGFAALTASGFAVSAQLGALTAIVLAIALIADFLLLPALLVWLDRGGTTGGAGSRSVPRPKLEEPGS